MGGEGAALPPALVALLEMDHISGFNHDGRAEGRGVYNGLHLGGFLVCSCPREVSVRGVMKLCTWITDSERGRRYQPRAEASGLLKRFPAEDTHITPPTGFLSRCPQSRMCRHFSGAREGNIWISSPQFVYPLTRGWCMIHSKRLPHKMLEGDREQPGTSLVPLSFAASLMVKGLKELLNFGCFILQRDESRGLAEEQLLSVVSNTDTC